MFTLPNDTQPQPVNQSNSNDNSYVNAYQPPAANSAMNPPIAQSSFAQPSSVQSVAAQSAPFSAPALAPAPASISAPALGFTQAPAPAPAPFVSSPVAPAMPPVPPAEPMPPALTPVAAPEPAAAPTPVQPIQPVQLIQPLAATPPVDDLPQPPPYTNIVDPFEAPIAPAAPAPSSPSASPAPAIQASAEPAKTSQSEGLEEQNIFVLLGVMDGTDEEKEKFLDELQQVIWEDFLENDLELLVTEEELQKVKQMLAQDGKTEAEKQESVVEFLEGLIPDLEEIMLEKALELKEDMIRERVTGMKDLYSGNAAIQEKIAAAEQLFSQNKWFSGAQMLNSLK